MDANALLSWMSTLPGGGIGLRLAIVLAAYLLAAFAATRLTVRMGRAQKHSPDRIRNALNAVRLLLRLLFALILLVVLGVDLAAIPTFLGSLLAVIGVACFASWSVLSNITSGFIIYAAKDLHVGDLLRIGTGEAAVEGRIAEFRLWTLLLRRDDGSAVIYPNSLLLQVPIAILQRVAGEGHTTQLIQRSS